MIRRAASSDPEDGGAYIPQAWTRVVVTFEHGEVPSFDFSGPAVVSVEVDVETSTDPPRRTRVRRVGIENDSGYNLIVFDLESADGDAVLAMEPLLWVSGFDDQAGPCEAPPGVTVDRLSGTRCVVHNLNVKLSGDEPSRQPFHFQVFSRGQFHTSRDPTIVNKVPSDPPPSKEPPGC